MQIRDIRDFEPSRDVIRIQCPNCKDTHGIRLDGYDFRHEWREPVSETKTKKKGYKIHYVAVSVECLNCGNLFRSDAYLA